MAKWKEAREIQQGSVLDPVLHDLISFLILKFWVWREGHHFGRQDYISKPSYWAEKCERNTRCNSRQLNEIEEWWTTWMYTGEKLIRHMSIQEKKKKKSDKKSWNITMQKSNVEERRWKAFQWGYGVSFSGGIQNPAGHNSAQPALGESV